jgi:hypothetical protein
VNDVADPDYLSPEQRAYEDYWYAQTQRRKTLTALGRTLVPCAKCETVSAYALCGLCSCRVIAGAG